MTGADGENGHGFPQGCERSSWGRSSGNGVRTPSLLPRGGHYEGGQSFQAAMSGPEGQGVRRRREGEVEHLEEGRGRYFTAIDRGPIEKGLSRETNSQNHGEL